MLFYALSGLINGIIATVFGIFTYLKNPKGKINRTYAVLSLWIALWGYAYYFFPISQNNKNQVLLSFQILQIGAIFIGPAFLHFVLSLLNLQKQKKIIIKITYFLGMIFTILDFTPFFIRDMVPKLNFYYWANPGIAYHFYLFFWSFCIIYPWYLIIKKFGEFPEFKQNQIKYVFIASVIGFIGGATNYPLWYNIPIPPVGTFLVGVHVLILAYAIAKYRLMDISVTITRAGIFLSVYTVVLGLPFILATSGKPWLISILGSFWWIGPLVLMASLGTGGPFVYLFLKNSAEAIILREQRRYQAVLKNAAVDLTRIRNLQKLLDFIAKVITESVKISYSAIYFFDAKADRFILKAETNAKKDQSQTIDTGTVLISWLKKEKEALVYEEIRYLSEHDPEPVFKKIEAQMRSLNATVVIPCFLENTLLDIIILGDKLSGKIYSQEDLDNFSVLAGEAALATENALLYDKIENEVKDRTHELVDTQKQLVQAEKLATVGTLAGGVAHEINNPLTAILTNVQMLLSTGELDKESLEMIEEATKRCKTIVQKLMTYAKKPMETTMVYKINTLEVINNAVNFLKFQLEQDNIKIKVDAVQDDYPIKGNHNEIEQVITNIVLNARDAIKQIKRSGLIEISLSQKEDSVKIEIRDEGVGIPKDIINRIFDPFFTTKEVGKGLGLGLSICQTIVEKHNGKITVQSEVNKGATFTVLLPRLKDKAMANSQAKY